MDKQPQRVAHKSWTIQWNDSISQCDAERIGSEVYNQLSYKQESLRLKDQLKLAKIVRWYLIFIIGVLFVVALVLGAHHRG